MRSPKARISQAFLARGNFHIPSSSGGCRIRQFQRFTGLSVKPAENGRKVIRVPGIVVIDDDVVRPDKTAVTAEHVEFTLSSPGKVVFGDDKTG